MSGKFNNRTLLVIFLILAGIFIITRFTSLKKQERTLAAEIVRIDTSKVSSVLLYPAAEDGGELTFRKEGASWTVSKEGQQAPADRRSVSAMLGELQNLETEQLVARSPGKWGDYSVDDSLGSRVVIKEGDKTTLDLVVGRFHYQPPPQNSYNPYGQNQVTGKTYVRLSAEDEVYSVEGFLAMSINQPFDRWRDQTVTRLNTSSLSRIVFDYPADSGYIAEKGVAGWMVAGLLADSTSMDSYLNRIARKSHSQFADGFQPGAEPDYTVSFQGDNMKTQQIKAYIREDGSLALNGTVNPGTWFSVPREGLFRDLFPGSGEFLPGSE